MYRGERMIQVSLMEALSAGSCSFCSGNQSPKVLVARGEGLTVRFCLDCARAFRRESGLAESLAAPTSPVARKVSPEQIRGRRRGRRRTAVVDEDDA